MTQDSTKCGDCDCDGKDETGGKVIVNNLRDKSAKIATGDDSFSIEDIEDLSFLDNVRTSSYINRTISVTPEEDDASSKKNVRINVNGTRRPKQALKSKDIEENTLSNDLDPSSYLIYVKTWGCSHNSSDSEYMAGLLQHHGFRVTSDDSTNSDLWLLNSCTVKGPSEEHFKNELDGALNKGKYVVLAGCVPQADRKKYKDYSTVGVQQIDQIVSIVEETLRGNVVSEMKPKKAKLDGETKLKKLGGACLELPKVRKNELVEIIPVSTGCLNSCTYCKTKLARGDLASYHLDELLDRAKEVLTYENIKEIWLTSEDLGAWGIDLGLTIVDLLKPLSDLMPAGTRLRLGMTNPPYILNHLEAIAEILNHPRVYKFLHIPVQSGSDSVLADMKREYCVKDFETIVDFLLEKVPHLTIATDIICGYPTETEQDFEETYNLIRKYKFRVLYINQFYPRPGTRAAKLSRLPTSIVKNRTRKLTDLFYSYLNRFKEEASGDIGSICRNVLFTDIAYDKKHLVGHDEHYNQILVKPAVGGTEELLTKELLKLEPLYGQMVDVKITEISSKFSKLGEPLSPTRLRCGLSSSVGYSGYLKKLLMTTVTVSVFILILAFIVR